MLALCSSLLSLMTVFAQDSASRVTAEEGFRIAGVVVDATSGQPLENARVFIGAPAVPNSGQSVTTAEDGRFTFESLARGHYTLSAAREGYLNQRYKQHESFSTAIIVGPDLDTSNLRFEMRPEASISGEVVDEMGEPVRDAQVLLIQQGLQFGTRRMREQRRANSDDLGHYRFGHLQPGTYFVAVSAQPWYAQRVNHQRQQRVNGDGQVIYENVTSGEAALDVIYPIMFFSNARDLPGAVPLTLRSGDEQRADFNLQPIPALHLTIRSPSVGEGENVWPQISQQITEGVQQPVRANVQQVEPGVFEVTGLRAGRLNLGLHLQKGNESTLRSQTLQLAQDAELNLAEAPVGAKISGVAKMENGSPLPQAGIQLHNRTTGEAFAMQVESNGEFALQNQQVPPGEYDVFLDGAQAVAIKSISAAGAKVSGRSIDIAGGEDVKLTVLVAKGTGRITGVAFKNGKPVDGVMVVLVPEIVEHNLVLFRRDQSDSDGSFNLPNILPGKYTVVALENGWDLDWFTPGVLQKYLSGGEAVDVTANSKLEVKVNVQ
jgi:Carboxypeptidase regulatory-like domain